MALLLATTTIASGQQHFVGIKGGWGLSDARLYPAWDTPKYWGMKTVALGWKMYNPDRYDSFDKYISGVAAELVYIERGYQYESYSLYDTFYRRKFKTLMLPLFWEPHLQSANKRFTLFLNAGFNVMYNFDSTEQFETISTGEVRNEKYEFKLVRDNRWGYGLCGGVGMGYTFGSIQLMVEGRYYYGYSDILKRKTVYPDTPFLRSPVDNIEVMAGVYYHFGRDFKAATSDEAVKARADKRAARRAARRNNAAVEKP